MWFNTGTLCNLACRHCYIESSPKNDRLAYLTADEVAGYLDEIAGGGFATSLIGFTGGEPFMNPELTLMLDGVLSRDLRALVLTNAMKPMDKCKPALLQLRQRFGDRLTIRVSIDHYGPRVHETSEASAAGSRRSAGCNGWPGTGSRCTSPAGVFRANRKQRSAAALPRSSPRPEWRSMPKTRSR